MTEQPIPLVDLGAQHAEVADDVAAGWAAVLAKTAFINGPQVAEFERPTPATPGQPLHRRRQRHGRAGAGAAGDRGARRRRVHPAGEHVHRHG